MDIKLIAYKLTQQCYDENEDCPMTCIDNLNACCPFDEELDCEDVSEQQWEEVLNRVKEYHDSLLFSKLKS